MSAIILLKSARKGDSDAFYHLISKYKDQLYRIALAYLKNEQDALEAMQEVTFRAYKNIKKVKEPKYFSTWVTRIMINYCNDELKRMKKVTLNESVIQFTSFTEENDKRLSMEAIVGNLAPHLQEVIILKYFEDLTIEQIAAELNRPSGTVKTWLNKALRTLRKQLKKEDEFNVSK